MATLDPHGRAIAVAGTVLATTVRAAVTAHGSLPVAHGLVLNGTRRPQPSASGYRLRG